MNKLEQELQKIDEFMKTPVHERPRYKSVLEAMKYEHPGYPLIQPDWLELAKLKLKYGSLLQRIQEEESEEYLRQANDMTKLALQLYNNE